MEDDFIDGELENPGEVIDSDKVDHRLRLRQLVSEMSPDEKSAFLKILQYKAIKELLEAMKDMKNTPAETWKHVIMRLKALVGINAPNSKFDFSALLVLLIPLVGALAGTLLALRQADEEKIDSAEPEATVLDDKELEETSKKINSVVLKYCKNNENDFSLNGK